MDCHLLQQVSESDNSNFNKRRVNRFLYRCLLEVNNSLLLSVARKILLLSLRLACLIRAFTSHREVDCLDLFVPLEKSP
jgi:hypothetical protein